MLKDKQKRLQILGRVDAITDNYCKGCEFNAVSKKDYCNNKCQYGKELLQLGVMLGKNDTDNRTKDKKKKEVAKVKETKEPKVIRSQKVERTKEECKRLLDEGYKVKQIAELMGLSPNNLSTLKNNKWGLNGYRPDHKKGIVVGYDLRDEKSLEVAKEAEDPTKKLHTEITRLKKENEDKEMEIDELHKSREKLGFRFKETMNANDELAHTNSHLRSQIYTLKKQKSEPKEESDYADLERNYIQVKQALEEMKKSYVYLENQIDAANEEIGQLDATVVALKDALKLVL